MGSSDRFPIMGHGYMIDRNRDIERKYSIKEMATKLRRIADRLEKGKLFRIQLAGKRINVPANAVFTIEHEREGDNEELEFQFKWKHGIGNGNY